MTALALDYAQEFAEPHVAQPAAVPYDPLSYTRIANEDTDCNRYLWLQITILAPLSALLWTGIGWEGYRLASYLFG